MMKKAFGFILFLLPVLLHSQNQLAGGHDYQVYYTPEGNPYLENYFWISGPSLTYTDDGNVKKGGVEVVVIFSQNDEVVSYDKYVIASDEYALNDSTYGDLLDMKRYKLPSGTTEFEMFITDINDKKKGIERKDTLAPKKGFTQEAFLSEIEFVEMYKKTDRKSSFTKAGYDILPYVGSLYEESVNTLSFYAELYDTDQDFGSEGRYLLMYYLERMESQKQLQNYTIRRRETVAPVKPVLAEMNIQDLSAGNYNLVIEIRDSVNKLVTRKVRPFRRENTQYTMTEEDFNNMSIENTFVNSISDKDSIIAFIKSLKPISSETEIRFGKNVMKNGDPTLMKRYLLSFWTKRNNNDPYGDFKAYNVVVKAIDDKYGSNVSEGYNTDRGRVYLKYGPPSVTSQRYNEPNTYPYEIWQYYQLESQTNVRFVFYNRDMVSNNFTLLHSDLRGEINNRQWQMFLRQRNSIFDTDQNNPNDPNGNWSNDLYNQPR